MIDFIRYVLNYSKARREKQRKRQWRMIGIGYGSWTYNDTKRAVNYTVTLHMTGEGERHVRTEIHGGQRHDRHGVATEPLGIAAKRWELGGPVPKDVILDIDVTKQLVEAMVDQELGVNT